MFGYTNSLHSVHSVHMNTSQYVSQNSKQNIIRKTSLNTKTDKVEKLSKTLVFPSSAHLRVNIGA